MLLVLNIAYPKASPINKYGTVNKTLIILSPDAICNKANKNDVKNNIKYLLVLLLKNKYLNVNSSHIGANIIEDIPISIGELYMIFLINSSFVDILLVYK